MIPKSSSRLVVFAVVVLLMGERLLQAASDRIQSRIESSRRTFVLADNTHPSVVAATDLGEVPASQSMPRIVLSFKMTDKQQADLRRLVAAQQQRSNTQFHKWLTPEQFGERFGLSSSDLVKISAWLSDLGFTDIEVARSRTSISASASAAQVSAAFQTAIHRFRRNGVENIANASDPRLPFALGGLVSHVRGLNDFRPSPRILPRFTSRASGSHYIVPGDFATIYDLLPLYGSGIDGTGQVIAIVGQTDIQASDIEAFQTLMGLPVKAPQIQLYGTDPGLLTDDNQLEADLDIEWAGAVAKGATIVYVNSENAFLSAAYAVENNLASVISLSYGVCEADLSPTEVNSLNAIFQQANAQGITVVSASGDSGAADCEPRGNLNSPVTAAQHGLAVEFPASSPYVTAVGGTEFNEGAGGYWSAANGSGGASAVSYIPEIAWNDGVDGTGLETGLVGTGGGVSTLFAKPAWQSGGGVPNDGFRDVPDVSLASSAAHDGYLMCTSGSCGDGSGQAGESLRVVGGTSVAAPALAGVVALLNQKMQAPQGNINPLMYGLASFSTDAFHDITSGSNQVPCMAGTPDCPAAAAGTASASLGYVAGPGYDQVTGLGSVDAYNLVNEWNSDFNISISPSYLTVPVGGSGTATVTVGSFGNFAGTVSFSCSVPGSLAGTTCSIPGTVSKSGTAALTITDTSSKASGSPWHPSTPSGGSKFALGLALVGLAAANWFRRQQRMRYAGGSLALFSVLAMTACGGGSSSSNEVSQVVQPSVTGTVTVTATSGTIVRTATISVTD